MKAIDDVIRELEFSLYDGNIHKYHIENVLPYLKQYKEKCGELEKKEILIEKLNQKINQLEEKHKKKETRLLKEDYNKEWRGYDGSEN